MKDYFHGPWEGTEGIMGGSRRDHGRGQKGKSWVRGRREGTRRDPSVNLSDRVPCSGSRGRYDVVQGRFIESVAQAQ